VRIPESTKIAAVGETTASALALAGYRVDLVPEKDNSARGLVAEWRRKRPSGRMLVPHAETPEENLVSGLADLGVEAEFVTAYRTVGVLVAASVAADVASGRIGGILITSGSVARQVQAQLSPLPAETVVAAIGPRTAFDARAAGIAIDAIAEARTANALVDALVDHVLAHPRAEK
jgi:uroporphyrinogen-III synthase